MTILDTVSSLIARQPTLNTAFQNLLLPTGIELFRLILLLIVMETRNDDYNQYEVPPPNKFYDFIVVGAGSAGSVVGARLAEEPKWDVLVLESGGAPPAESYIPGLGIFLYVGEADWGYRVAPQKTSMFGYAGRSNIYPRGRVIGGTSGINFMLYVRGNRLDFDNWAALGNSGWDYNTVLQYFKKSEDFVGKTSDDDISFHGIGGPLTVSSKSWSTCVAKAFVNAGIELGYGKNDPNGANQTGFSIPHVTIKRGIRASTGEAFLKPNLRKKNLNVVPHSHVKKILFDNKRAIGVVYTHKGKDRMALAKKEVILSAGAIDSPKLLMLSGIGPKEHLNKFRIKVVHDLPGVGQNLQDHPFIFGLTWTTKYGVAYSPFDLLSPLTMTNYLFKRCGPWSAPFAAEGIAWIPIDTSNSNWPDSQYLLLSVTPTFEFGLLLPTLIGYDRELYEEYFKAVQGKEGFVIAPTLIRPKSRGSITLNSTNPFDQPVIDPKFLSHPDDLDLMIKAIKVTRQIGDSQTMKKKLDSKFHDKPLPGCAHFTPESYDYWACYAQYMTSSAYHPTGTCKMAPSEDEMGVVDNKLRVRGVSGLRVIDASIMPQVVSGNPNAASIMIGERGADLIKEEWKTI